jgi:Fur family transcriptional regulator, ferric uptake regulator
VHEISLDRYLIANHLQLEAQVKDYKNAFRLYLKGEDAKLTNQRSIILNAVFSTHSHFDAESLFLLIQEQKNIESVSLTSIYRTLPLLLDAGLIKRSPGNPSKEQYEHTYGHPEHCHLECSKCGIIIEEKVTHEQRNVLQNMTDKFGFKTTELEIHLLGICKSCLQKMKKNT